MLDWHEVQLVEQRQGICRLSLLTLSSRVNSPHCQQAILYSSHAAAWFQWPSLLTQ